MHSGNRNSGFVGREELQQLFLPSILETYSARGYCVREVVGSQREVALMPNVLTDKLTPVTLEHVIVEPEVVTGLHPGHGYAASPGGWHNGSKLHLNDKIFVAQYHGIEFNALLFLVTQTGVIVRNDNPQKPVQLSFYEFHTALERWLPEASAAKARRRNGSNNNG